MESRKYKSCGYNDIINEPGDDILPKLLSLLYESLILKTRAIPSLNRISMQILHRKADQFLLISRTNLYFCKIVIQAFNYRNLDFERIDVGVESS